MTWLDQCHVLFNDPTNTVGGRKKVGVIGCEEEIERIITANICVSVLEVSRGDITQRFSYWHAADANMHCRILYIDNKKNPRIPPEQ